MIGMWSEPVDGRAVSQVITKGARDVNAKASSRTEGLPTPAEGNRGYTTGVLSMLYPRPEAREK